MVRDTGLPDSLDDEARILERDGVGLKWAMPAVKSHGEAVTLYRIGVPEGLKITSLDGKRRVGALTLEVPCGIDRVHDSDAEVAARLKHTCNFPHRSRHVVDVVKRHEGNGQIRAGFLEWKGCRVSLADIYRRVEFLRRSNKSRRRIHADNLMAEPFQVTGKPTFATAYVEGPPSGSGQEVKEQIAVISPIAVVARGTGPRDPLPGVSFPALTKFHEITLGGGVRRKQGSKVKLWPRAFGLPAPSWDVDRMTFGPSSLWLRLTLVHGLEPRLSHRFTGMLSRSRTLQGEGRPRRKRTT